MLEECVFSTSSLMLARITGKKGGGGVFTERYVTQEGTSEKTLKSVMMGQKKIFFSVM